MPPWREGCHAMPWNLLKGGGGKALHVGMGFNTDILKVIFFKD